MKRITVVSTSLEEEDRLSSLISLLKQDPEVELGQITSARHRDGGMDIEFFRVEANGILLDQQTRLLLEREENFAHQEEIQAGFSRALTSLAPELVILMGESHRAFGAATTVALEHGIPIAHINGGESRYDLYGPSYGCAISRLSTLHFTSCEACANQVLESGADPGLVFSVGALGLAPDQMPMARTHLTASLGWVTHTPFAAIALEADPGLGSKNHIWVEHLIQALDHDALSCMNLLFCLPENKGLNKLVRSPLLAMANAQPHRIRLMENLDNDPGRSALAHANALVTNTSKHCRPASLFATPVLYIGQPSPCLAPMEGQGLTPCRLEKSQMETRLLETMLKPPTRSGENTSAPFFQPDTAERIKAVITEFITQFQSSLP